MPAHESATKLAKITAYETAEDERELFLSALTQGISSSQAREYDSQKNEFAQARPRKKGRVDCSIDLHGMYAKDAVAALLRFIREEKAKGAKTMLVIHGKGSGVLKNAVWSIIKTHPDIHDFQPASWRHGGAGAIIIRVGSQKWRK